MILYGLAHLLRDRATPLWNLVEAANGRLFALSHRDGLSRIPGILSARAGQFLLREAVPEDAPALAEFFAAEPESSFEFFHPHAFDTGTLRRIAENPGFLAFVALEGGEIAGWFFIRCFAGGKGYAGWFVGARFRGRGLAKIQISVLTEIARTLGIRLFCTVSPRNAASAAALKAVSGIRVLETLGDGSALMECLPKTDFPGA